MLGVMSNYQAGGFTVKRVRTPHRSRSADRRASKIRSLMLSEYTEGDSCLELSELKDAWGSALERILQPESAEQTVSSGADK